MKGTNMTQLIVLAQHTYAGHCATGNSNKIWAACLAVETDDLQPQPPRIDETTEVVYLSLHGSHGGNMVIDPPKKLAMQQARAHFRKKCREKEGKAYASIPFASYLPMFGRPFGLSLTSAAGEGQRDIGAAIDAPIPEDEVTPLLNYQPVIVKAISQEKLQQLLADESYGVSEKVNGERCLLVFDGERLAAYNRRGRRMSSPPTGAAHLCRLGCPFVIDGERLTGDLAGHFVAFDLLEWNGDAFISLPYQMRITTLEDAMLRAGLIASSYCTCTWVEASANSTVPQLSLLIGATDSKNTSHQVVEDVQASAGEGIVLRRLLANYSESPLKWKFVTDLDAFVLSVNEGLAEGSLKFGVRRLVDNAVIEVANVRSGFTDNDIRVVRSMLERGERPVFTITYLPIRTIGIQLVEPRSGLAFLRTDKDASECTTEQFGEEKALIIAQAKPVGAFPLL